MYRTAEGGRTKLCTICKSVDVEFPTEHKVSNDKLHLTPICTSMYNLYLTDGILGLIVFQVESFGNCQ